MPIYENQFAVQGSRGYLEQFLGEFRSRKRSVGFLGCFIPCPEEFQPIVSGNLTEILKQNAKAIAWRKEHWGIDQDIFIKGLRIKTDRTKSHHESIFHAFFQTEGPGPIAGLYEIAKDYSWLNFEYASVSEEADKEEYYHWMYGKQRQQKSRVFSPGLANMRYRFSMNYF